MGANASTANGEADDHTTRTANRIPDDLYELLDIEPTASADEIRKGFRKQALKWHPDKNAGSAEASRRFIKIQAAYDVLSDDQERAYYDAHRGDIGADDQESDADLRERAKRAANSKTAIRISSKQLMRFFDPSLWNADFSDGPNGFYAIYRQLFETVAQSELYATAPHGEPALSPPQDYPSFGNSYAMYDAPDAMLKRFYAAYLGFASRRPFNEVDKYRLQDAPDRRVKRLMEKENKRARDDARKEYNDTIRQLASFLKKRDPRFLQSTSSDPLRARQLERQKLQSQLKEAATEAAKVREAHAKNYREQDWQKVDTYEELSSVEDEDEEDGQEYEEPRDEGGLDGLDEGNEEDKDEEIPDWYCPACEKDFASQGAWDNHERSKKHLKNVQRLVREMQDEDEELGLSKVTMQELTIDEPEEQVIKLSKKERKKAKRNGQDTLVSTEASIDPIRAVIASEEEIVDDKAGIDEDKDSLRHEKEQDTDVVEVPEAPQMSKKDKRRAKEAAKKAAAVEASGAGVETPVESCNVCEEAFTSRSKLFIHIKDTGHASATSNGSSSKGQKKGKRR